MKYLYLNCREREMQLDGFYYQPSGAETTTGTSKVESNTTTTGGQEGAVELRISYGAVSVECELQEY